MEIFEAGKAEPWGAYGYGLVRFSSLALLLSQDFICT
jgi:hypothetical protein